MPFFHQEGTKIRLKFSHTRARLIVDLLLGTGLLLALKVLGHLVLRGHSADWEVRRCLGVPCQLIIFNLISINIKLLCNLLAYLLLKSEVQLIGHHV